MNYKLCIIKYFYYLCQNLKRMNFIDKKREIDFDWLPSDFAGGFALFVFGLLFIIG